MKDRSLAVGIAAVVFPLLLAFVYVKYQNDLATHKSALVYTDRDQVRTYTAGTTLGSGEHADYCIAEFIHSYGPRRSYTVQHDSFGGGLRIEYFVEGRQGAMKSNGKVWLSGANLNPLFHEEFPNDDRYEFSFIKREAGPSLTVTSRVAPHRQWTFTLVEEGKRVHASSSDLMVDPGPQRWRNYLMEFEPCVCVDREVKRGTVDTQWSRAIREGEERRATKLPMKTSDTMALIDKYVRMSDMELKQELKVDPDHSIEILHELGVRSVYGTPPAAMENQKTE